MRRKHHQLSVNQCKSPEVDEERVLESLHDLQLSEDVSDFISLDALLLVHVFHGVHLPGVCLLHDTHLQTVFQSSQ